MADSFNFEAPDFPSINQVMPAPAAQGLYRVWLAAVEGLKRLRASIQVAKDRIEPLLFTKAHTVNMNNLDIGAASVLQFTGSAAVDLTGIVAPETGKNRILFLYNLGSGTVTLKHNSGSSATAHQLFCITAADFSLANGVGAIFVYFNKWYQVK